MKHLSMLIIQTLFLAAIAPLVSGCIRKMKNNLRMRKGPGVLQPYYNLAKLFAKDEVVSEHASLIFRVTPYIVLGSTVAALILVPVFTAQNVASSMGDVLCLFFILALGRFFISLSGLDTGSAFGGMGSSREMFISSLVEPVAMLAIFAVGLACGSTSTAGMAGAASVHFSSIIAAAAFLIVTIAETSRIPVDNQETHLELTMVHEAMFLEYSGRSLALMELAAHLKQIVFFSLIANVILPFGMPLSYSNIGLGMVVYIAKMGAIAVIIGVIEISVAKMRLFRVVDFLSLSLVLSIMAIIAVLAGI